MYVLKTGILLIVFIFIVFIAGGALTGSPAPSSHFLPLLSNASDHEGLPCHASSSFSM